MSNRQPSIDTQAMRDLLHALQGNILRDPRTLHTFQRFTGLPQMISKTPWASSEEAIFNPVLPPISVWAYFRDTFPDLKISPERYVATSSDYTTDRDIVVHHAITAALARNGEDPLLRFLVVAVVIHQIGHTLRDSFWSFSSWPTPMEQYPFYSETCTPGSIYAESGFEAEISIFGGIIGVVFQDEQQQFDWDGTFPFFDLDYTRIACFCLTTPNQVTYKLDDITIRSRMLSSSWLDAFDPSKLEIIETPPFFQHRLCAVLNSTHLARPDADTLAPLGQDRESVKRDEYQRTGPPLMFSGRRDRCIPMKERFKQRLLS
ncbi:hypothetical protein B0H16DRAFT_1884515 [Mycena metata]|uniref:Uncharacterized protein n=1 Tax=Mycena metata TaxID=1033252 RepID=A0AAD7JBC2_9AGAR|nr:hypothetical protein B0H16DRAFT_1884515 [Mycena metata]